MARATKNSISGGLLESEPRMRAYDAIASTLPKGAARSHAARSGANASPKSRRRWLNGALVAALTQLPARSHLGQPVLQVGEHTAKSRCASLERCSSPIIPSPPGSLLQISKQTLGPPSPFVAVPAQLVLVHL